MLTIRLSRTGKRHKPQYRVVLQEKNLDPWAPAQEILGHHNPHTKETILKEERIKHWLSVGAQPSVTVQNMLIKAGIMKADVINPIHITKKRTQKLEEKRAEAEEKKRAAEEAKKAAEEAAKAEAEAKAAEEAAAKEAEAAAAAEEAKEEATEAPAEETTEEASTDEAPAEETAETEEKKEEEPAAEEAGTEE